MPLNRRAAGFTLVEVVVAIALLATVSTAVAGLFGVAIAAGRDSRDRTLAAVLAASKLEQLRALEWRAASDGTGLVNRSDLETDLSAEPASGGGPGLSPSPAGTLDANVPFYVDYLDRRGRWVGTGPSPSTAAVYIRRWAVRPLPSDPHRTIALQVLVTTVQREHARVSGNTHAWNGQDVLLSTLLTRKVR